MTRLTTLRPYFAQNVDVGARVFLETGALRSLRLSGCLDALGLRRRAAWDDHGVTLELGPRLGWCCLRPFGGTIDSLVVGLGML